MHGEELQVPVLHFRESDTDRYVTRYSVSSSCGSTGDKHFTCCSRPPFHLIPLSSRFLFRIAELLRPASRPGLPAAPVPKRLQQTGTSHHARNIPQISKQSSVTTGQPPPPPCQPRRRIFSSRRTETQKELLLPHQASTCPARVRVEGTCVEGGLWFAGRVDRR